MTAYHEITSELLISEHTDERFVSEYVQNGKRTLDVVQKERLRYGLCS